MTTQEKITEFTKKAPYGTLLGHTMLSRPKHAQLPDYPYGYTVRAFKVDGATFTYSQIMWDFQSVDKDLVGLKEDDFPWDNEELAWLQGSENLAFENTVDLDRVERLF